MRILSVTLIALSACQLKPADEAPEPAPQPAFAASPAVVEAALAEPAAAESGGPCVEVLSRRSFGPASGNSRVVCLLDADGDGALDVFVGAFNEPDALYWNDGQGSLASQTSTTVGSGSGPTFGVATADLNGDGRSDLLVVQSDKEANLLQLNLGGRQGFASADGGSLTEHARDSYGAACADFDLDGDMDAVVVNRSDHNELHLNDGRAHFGAAAAGPLSLEGGNSRAVVCADLDGDGDDDVVIANWGSNAHAVYLNHGAAQGGQPSSFAQDRSTELAQVSAKSSGVAPGDLDGDGDLDLVFSNRKGEANEVWLNGGAGLFSRSAAALPAGDGGNSTDVAVADLNRDGLPDLLILNRQGPPYLYLNDGDASFSACLDVSLAKQPLESTACAWGDLQGDGGLDLVIVDAVGPDLWLRMGPGIR